MRGSFTCESVITPKFAEPKLVFGPPNCGVLPRLYALARSCILAFSVREKLLKIAKSTFTGICVRMPGSTGPRVFSVLDGNPMNATGSLAEVQFWRTPAALSEQVLNHCW